MAKKTSKNTVHYQVTVVQKEWIKSVCKRESLLMTGTGIRDFLRSFRAGDENRFALEAVDRALWPKGQWEEKSMNGTRSEKPTLHFSVFLEPSELPAVSQLGPSWLCEETGKFRPHSKNNKSTAHTSSYLMSTRNLITLPLGCCWQILVSCALSSGLNHAQESGRGLSQWLLSCSCL